MSGVAVIWYLLKTNAPVLDVVPAPQIKSGDLPLGTVMPAIAVRQISSVPFNLLRVNEANRFHTDRVQVSVLYKDQRGTPAGAGYRGVKTLLRLVLAACAGQRGTVNGVAVDSISPDIEGPDDLADAALSLISGSRDFIVRYTEASASSGNVLSTEDGLVLTTEDGEALIIDPPATLGDVLTTEDGVVLTTEDGEALVPE